MTRMLLTAVTCGALVVAVACEPEENPAAGDETAAALKDAAKAASDLAEQVEESATRAVSRAEPALRAATVSVEELAEIAQSSFSMKKLEELSGSLNVESLEKVATRIGDAIREQSGVIQKYQAEIADLDVTRALEASRLESMRDDAKTLLADLKEKFAVVVEQLKAQGVDVSSFAELLEGS